METRARFATVRMSAGWIDAGATVFSRGFLWLAVNHGSVEMKIMTECKKERRSLDRKTEGNLVLVRQRKRFLDGVTAVSAFHPLHDKAGR